MKLLTKGFLYLLLLLWLTPLRAQEFKSTIPKDMNQGMNIGLHVGDEVPNIKLQKIFNNNGISNHLWDYSDSLIIVDFWSTNCSGCVSALPYLDSLQKAFGKRILILPVTAEKMEIVQNFWNNNKYTKHLSLPSIVEDSIFSNLFRHQFLSHEVWIFKGKVIGITNPDFVDENNITKVLEGKAVNWPVKNDFLTYNVNLPLFKVDSSQIGKNANLEYEAISGYKEGINSSGLSGGWGIIRNIVDKTIRLYFLNTPIYSMFTVLNNLAGNTKNIVRPLNSISPNQILWQIPDRNTFQYISIKESGYEQEWIRKYGLCFESVALDKGQSDKDIYKQAIKDLNRLLGLNIRWQKMIDTVWVLRTSKSKIMRLKNGISINEFIIFHNQLEGTPYIFNNVTNHDLLLPMSVIKTREYDQIRKIVKECGFVLSKEARVVDKYIFGKTAELLPDADLIDSNKIVRKQPKWNFVRDSISSSEFLIANSKLPYIITLKSGLQYQVLKSGRGIRPALNDLIQVHYVGKTIDGQIFDSSLSRGIPLSIKLPDVIRAWQEALPLMNVGSKWRIFSPSLMAYGKEGKSGKFPPYSTLIFDIEILQIIK